MEKRNYHVIIGSKSFFDEIITQVEGEKTSFLDLVQLRDNLRQIKDADKSLFEKIKVPLLVVKNDNYHGIVDAAHDRLGGLIEDLTLKDAVIYIHNPPQTLKNYLLDQYERKIIELTTQKEEYQIKREPSSFFDNIEEIKKSVIGQDHAIDEVSKSLWYLTNVKRSKPYVIMLYGNSSLGKTELVREIAAKFFDGKYLEKHLSMFKNNNYSDYFFGDSPNRKSIGFDLLERESNLIFFDEIDKCPEYFYSAFYTLFDNTLFKDATYDVDISGTIMILTSNYLSEEEIQNALGMPVFYRIDKFIHFNDFSTDTIHELIIKELSIRNEEVGDKIDENEIYKIVSRRIRCSGENARTIKYKIQQVIEDILYDDINRNE